MNKVFKRALLVVVFSAALLAGILFFLYEYMTDGPTWVRFYANAHIYSGGDLNTGRIVDRRGALLIETENGSHQFNESSAVRRATMHAVGDTGGNVATGVYKNYADKLVGYDLLNGVYSFAGEGTTLSLSLDAELCAAALEALGGYKGTVGIYNYKTGELLCMVSAPTFDIADPPELPEAPGDAWDGVYINRFISSTYTPGSIFKLVTAQAAIEEIPDIYSRRFTCEGSIELPGGEIRCSGVHGEIGFDEALAYSCNVAFAEIAVELGEDTLTGYAEKAGVTDSFSFSRMPTARGSFDVSDTTDSELAWAGIGQYTDLVNPCGFMVYMGAVANDGVAVYPSLVEKTTNAIGLSFPLGDPKNQTRMMPSATARKLKQMMRNNVESYYGQENFPGLKICAKSGTAELSSGSEPHSVFAGFLDDSEHPYAFVVIAENAGAGRGVAGSVANAVLQKAVQLAE